LTNSTFPYLLELANLGFARAVEKSPALRAGVNTCGGEVTHPGVAESQGRTLAELHC
jgi:alanine dehydrogenase